MRLFPPRREEVGKLFDPGENVHRRSGTRLDDFDAEQDESALNFEQGRKRTRKVGTTHFLTKGP